ERSHPGPTPSEKKSQMHWAMLLHNELQRQSRLSTLSWDDKGVGPSHNVVWTSVVLINEIEYGRGSARKKQSARDEAAKNALETLQDELFEPVSLIPSVPLGWLTVLETQNIMTLEHQRTQGNLLGAMV
ncbi:hypothetical protein JB92DRAFT_2762799, partial [Gautieria morchelliformis]